jgi:hypothetical protein
MMQRFQAQEKIKSFQQYVLDHYSMVRREGIVLDELAGTKGLYKSKMLPRVTVTRRSISECVMLHPSWPTSAPKQFRSAFRSFLDVTPDKIVNYQGPAAAVARLAPECAADAHSLLGLRFWETRDNRLGMLLSLYTSDLFDLPVDLLTGTMIHQLVAAIYDQKRGPLLFQGNVHIHQSDLARLEMLSLSPHDIDGNKFTQWHDVLLPLGTDMMVKFDTEGRGLSIDNRFALMQSLVGETVKELEKARYK